MPEASPLLRDWQLATVAAIRDETPSVRTIAFSLPQWTGHLAGQHVDVRLTSDDGYQAERSYSIASPSGRTALIEITVERIADGEAHEARHYKAFAIKAARCRHSSGVGIGR